MTPDRRPDQLHSLIHELRQLPKETAWVEFKENEANPEVIGEYLSALANSAALEGKAFAYLVWGIEDETHKVVGTQFSPNKEKIGNEELENWLLRLLVPKIHFRFLELAIDGVSLVLLEIGRAARHPVAFKNQEFIRVGSYKKRLRDFPEKERELWRLFDQVPFEDLPAVEDVRSEDLLKLMDYPAYFDLLKLPLPETRDVILESLLADNLIARNANSRWNITNLGGILFAKKLSEFRTLKRKAVRVISYKGDSRVTTIRELDGIKGYATGFEGIISFINSVVPSNEEIGKAFRKTVPMYPELAVRELVANAIIHQDLSVTGSGPMIEIFSERMEITNPGVPLVKTERFLDSPPRSRNESLASFMRRIGVCEERGSGIDKVVMQTEIFQLPAPLFEVTGDHTRTVLFSHRPLTGMEKTDRIRACYLHSCLRYVSRNYMTNSSLRERFGISPRNSATASRLIKEALEDGVICPYDANAAPRLRKYLPWWADKGSS